MNRKTIRQAIIDAGVKNLREFGYPQANKDNILTTTIYRAFFVRMLEDEENAAVPNADFQAVRTELLKELKQE